MENQNLNEQVLNEEEVNEVSELNKEFVEFLNTKGIKAKFKLAFHNISESAKKQHQKDVESFNEVKAKSIEENREFYDNHRPKGYRDSLDFRICTNDNGEFCIDVVDYDY